MKREIDMLSGSLWDKILVFVIPLAVTGILQQVFNAADIAVVGRFVNENAMAAVGNNGSLVGLMISLFIGMSLGTNVVIAQYIGHGDRTGIRRAVSTSIIAAAVGGLLFLALGEVIAVPMIRLLAVPEEIFGMTLLYLRIYFLGMPVIFLYNVEAAIFRSKGDTRTPMIVLIIAGVINVGLNLFLVCVAGMTVEGVAIATVVANLISAAILFVLLCRSRDDLKIDLKELRFDRQEFLRIVRIGVPSGIQSMVFSIANLCIQSGINSLGTTVMAASAAALNIEIIAFYLLNSFTQACTTFVGQNYGAGNIIRCKKVWKDCILLAIIFTAAMCITILVFSRPLLGLFNKNPEVIELGRIRLFYLYSAYLFSLLADISSGYLRGFGKSLTPALATVFTVCGTRILWVYTVFRQHGTFGSLLLVYPVSLGLNALVIGICALLFSRKILQRPLQEKL
ncbi:MAG: MATE family efflux transporter [Firmicutes bacterium]|nr:MATE family efflux transporter [Bacillota bacterium]MBR6503742.1 MATE family efflux transporter [Bacillota bacterium]